MVVLTDEDDRQVPELGQVKSLRHLALVGRPVAVQRKVDTAVAFVFVSKGDTRAQRDLERLPVLGLTTTSHL